MLPAENHPLGRRERKKLATRRRILESALGLFEEKGYEATTVEEIAERADVAKGTVFNHFPQKRAFLLAAYGAWVDLLLDRFGPVERWKGPIRTQLERLFGFLVDLSVAHRPIARLVVFENMRVAHERMTVLHAGTEAHGKPDDAEGSPTLECRADAGAVRAMEDMIQTLLEKGQARGEIRADVDPAQGASLLAAVVFHTLVGGLVGNASGQEIKATLAAKLDIIFTGLAP